MQYVYQIKSDCLQSQIQFSLTRTLFQIVYLINCKRYILNIYFSFFIISISYVYITCLTNIRRYFRKHETSIILNFILLNIMSLLNCVSTVSPYCVFFNYDMSSFFQSKVKKKCSLSQVTISITFCVLFQYLCMPILE